MTYYADVLPWDGYPGKERDADERRAHLWPRHRARERRRRRRRTSLNNRRTTNREAEQ